MFIKKNEALFLTILLNIMSTDALATDIKLKSPVLGIIDGIPGIMDEHIIHKTVYIGHEVYKFQNGIPNKETKKREPQFEFKGNLYNLKELAKLEEEYKNNSILTAEINALLAKVKEEFLDITDPFIKDAQGSKQQMVILITEYCYHPKVNRKDSLLLNWSKSTNEHESLKRNVKTFKILDSFCTDLMDFLKVLVRNCPKALRKYQEKNSHRSFCVIPEE